jgi:hypothetical protein
VESLIDVSEEYTRLAASYTAANHECVRRLSLPIRKISLLGGRRYYRSVQFLFSFFHFLLSDDSDEVTAGMPLLLEAALNIT